MVKSLEGFFLSYRKCFSWFSVPIAVLWMHAGDQLFVSQYKRSLSIFIARARSQHCGSDPNKVSNACYIHCMNTLLC